MQRHYTLLPSRYLALLLSIVHGAALYAVALLPLPFAAWFGLSLLLLFNLGRQLWIRAWLGAPSAIVAFSLEDDGLVLTSRSGGTLHGALLGNSVVTPCLTILNVLPGGAHRPHSVLIFPDSLDAASFRQLRVNLRWGALS
ncbi:MAG: hypothetical protein HYZ46_02660 [Nitrosomonadales bacterium]|nr:hypothetical protein [Nitrosomonadales bacterium]